MKRHTIILVVVLGFFSLSRPARGDFEIDKKAPSNGTEEPDRSALMRTAQKLGFSNLTYYDSGVYGKVGSTVTFISSTDEISDWDRLYQVMVRVLSEKYGCFMQKRIRDGHRFQFFCTDERVVVMERLRKSNVIGFYSRQYTKDGTELIVQNHQIIGRKPAH